MHACIHVPWHAYGNQKSTWRSWFFCSVGPRDEAEVTRPDKGKCLYLWSHLSDSGIFILFYFYGFWARTDLELIFLCLPPKCWDHKHMLSHLLRIWFWILPSPVTSLRSHSDDTGKVCYVIKFLTAQSPGSCTLFSNRMNHEVMMISFLLNCFSFSKQYKMKRRGKSYLLWFVL